MSARSNPPANSVRISQFPQIPAILILRYQPSEISRTVESFSTIFAVVASLFPTVLLLFGHVKALSHGLYLYAKVSPALEMTFDATHIFDKRQPSWSTSYRRNVRQLAYRVCGTLWHLARDCWCVECIRRVADDRLKDHRVAPRRSHNRREPLPR